MGDSGGFAGPGTPTVQDALRLSLNWHSGGPEGPAQIQAVINAVMAVSIGAGAPRARVPNGDGVDRAGKRWPRRHRRRRPSGIGGPFQWSLPFRAYSAANWLAMNAQRHFHEFGTTREQMAQIALNAPPQRRSQPQRDLPRADVDGRLLRGAHDHHAVLPLRLRRPGRRVDRGRRVGRRARGRRRPSGRARRSGRHRAARPAVVGPVGRHDVDARTRRRRAHVVAHRPATGRRRRRRALRRVQLARDGVARGARILRTRRERTRSSRAASASRSTASSRSTPTAASCRPAGCTVSASCTKRWCSCAETAAIARSPAQPEVAVVANGGGPVAGAMLLTRLVSR